MATLTIRNDEACRLIRELAEREGKTMTEVVIEAVREKLEREPDPHVIEERIEYWADVGQRIRDDADPEWLAADLTDDLYDEDGLPTHLCGNRDPEAPTHGRSVFASAGCCSTSPNAGDEFSHTDIRAALRS